MGVFTIQREAFSRATDTRLVPALKRHGFTPNVVKVRDHSVHFGRRRHGAAAARIFTFTESCTCFRYRGGNIAVP